MALEDKLTSVFDDREAFINKAISGLDDSLKIAARKMYELILDEYVSKLQTTDGKITWSVKNIAVISELDKVLDKFSLYLKDKVLSGVASDMVSVTNFSKDYFVLLGFSQSTVDKIGKGIETLHKTIGIDSKGELIKGGYLDNLSGIGTVKDEIKQYVTAAVAQKQDYKVFLKGMKDLVVGNPKVDSRLASYYRQYTHDTFFAMGNATDNYFAQQFGMNYFRYSGTVIKTTRPFCKEKVGKIFSRSEAKEWESEDFAGKNDPYDPFVLPGGYNCRHRLMWIPDKLAIMERGHK